MGAVWFLGQQNPVGSGKLEMWYINKLLHGEDYGIFSKCEKCFK